MKRAFFPTWRGTIVGSLCALIPSTGLIEGVVYPEASTHSSVQGDFIPTVNLGIHGNAVMALLLGALMIQGIVPGPQLISQHADIFWGLVASFWIGNIMLVLLDVPLIGIWVKMLRGLTTYEYICKIWTKRPEKCRFAVELVPMPPIHKRDRHRGLFASPGHFAVALALVIFGILSLWNHQCYVAPIVVILVTDLYIGAMLWKAACVSQKVSNAKKMFPELPFRTTGLVMLLMLAIALISAFAGLYIETNSVYSSTSPTEYLRNPIDAIYFSAVTITTLGYGDFLPHGSLARMFVVGELASGVLFLIGAIPLLISRMGELD
jgi:hypothetical protein